LCNISPEIYEIFRATNLNQQFRIERDPGEDDSDENWGGVTARRKPPKPSGGDKVSLPLPQPEKDD
jgi:hypothetical protein